MRFVRQWSALAVVGLLVGGSGSAAAQDSTTGAMRGVVRDKASREAIVGATVVASGPSLQGAQTSMSDETGHYFIANLPPGIYQIVIYYGQASFSRGNVLIQLGKTAQVNVDIDGQAAAGETVIIQGRAPLIDQLSTKTGKTITQDYTQNVPSGRTYGEILGAAPGAEADRYGTSVGGATSVENIYFVEGLNTTDPGYGLLSSNLPNEFIQETEIITGGYNAEYGRSTGGVINVITKAGSNEFHGSVFGYWTPGALSPAERASSVAGSAIDRQDNLDNSFDFGAEVGGPIVKDRLWFHVGFNPSFRFDDVSRILKTQVDRDDDGNPDLDGNGFTVLEEVDRTHLSENKSTYFYSAKLTGALTPDHQGSLAVSGSPGSEDVYGGDLRTGGLHVTGAQSAIFSTYDRNLYDISAKWTSKFFDNATQLDAVVGYHSDFIDQSAGLEEGEASQIRYEPPRPLGAYRADEDRYFNGVPAECDDAGADDPYPNIVNCPVPFYRTGGLDFIGDTDARRLSGLMTATQRVRALGHHVFKVGADFEDQKYIDSHHWGGGVWYRQRPFNGGVWQILRFNTPDPNGNIPCGIDYDGDGQTETMCRAIGDGEDLSAETSTRNLAAFAQDSWSILPNLTINAGVRWERQTLYAADGIRGLISPTTGKRIPDKAFELDNMIAPRLGVIYDWTQEGRSKLYGHYGRFYESIPMDINVRSFGGEVINVNVLEPDGCNVVESVWTCNEQGQSIFRQDIGGGAQLVAPGLGPQYLDEVVVGAEYEVLPDLKIGAAYVRRDLGNAIEDVSTDGGSTFVIANPGEVDEAAVADLRRRAMESEDPNDRNFLLYQADLFEGIGAFDRPKRTYSAFQVTVERRFTDAFFLSAAYTYSQTRGNFPGLFSHETGQLDPNMTAMYDLPEVMANRYGNLGSDHPHVVKLDGFYRLPVERIGFFTFGAAVRGSSGVPINALGASNVYGSDESFILERGTGGHIGFATRFDTHLAYGRPLSGGMRIEAFIDIFNLFNQQPEVRVDETYTFETVNPIVGGDREDLEHLKVTPSAEDRGGGRAPTLNPNYRNTKDRQVPLSARFGMRLVF